MKSRQGVIQVLPLLIISLLLVTIGALGKITYHGFNKQRLESQPKSESGFKKSWVTPTPIPTPTQEPAVKGTSNPDPIVTCAIHASCGGGSRQIKKSKCDNMNCCLIDLRCGGPKFITKSECTNSYCCLLKDGTGKLLSSKSACDNYYSNNSGGGIVSNIPTKNYYLCTLCYHYPSGDQCTTYNYLVETKAECDAEQAKIDSYGNSYVIPTSTPIPTQDNSQYQDLLKQHQEACNQAAAEWIGQREQFDATEYNNFSSSYEAVQELERRRQVYQQQLYDAGCTNTISLY